MGWYVLPSSIFTTLNHTYESLDLVVHRPLPPLQFLGGFGSDIWVYVKVDSGVAIVHHSIVRALSDSSLDSLTSTPFWYVGLCCFLACSWNNYQRLQGSPQNPVAAPAFRQNLVSWFLAFRYVVFLLKLMD